MTKSMVFCTASFLVFLLDCGLIRSGEKALLDVYGDLLPPGATARFGTLRWRIPKAIDAVAVSPNGKLVAAVNMEGKVAVWEMETGRLLHEISTSRAGAASIAFSPDGKYLATGGRPDYKTRDGDFRIRLWDLQTGKLKTLFPSLDNSPISKLVFTSDSATLISAGFGQPVTVWKSPSGEKVRTFPTGDDLHHYHNVALSPNEKWLVVSGDDCKTVTIFAFDGSRKLRTFTSKWNFFGSFEFSPDSKSLMTLEHDRLRFWNFTTGKPRLTIPLKHDFNRQAYLTPDGKKIAMIGLGHEIEWLDAATGKPLDSWKGYKDDSYTVGVLTFSRDGKSLVTGDWGVVRVWDTSTGKVVKQPSGPTKISYTLDFSADGKTVLAASVNGLYFLDGQTLQERVRAPVDLGRFYSAVLSPDGKSAAFARQKEEIGLVDSREPKRLRSLPSPGWVPASLAFSPDGKHLYATGDKAAGLRVWDAETGQEITPLDKDIRPLSNLSVARRAGKLAVVVQGAKPHCRLWDLRTGKEEPALELGTGPVKYGPDEILFSDDGQLLLAYHVNSHISIWDVAKKVERHRFEFTFEDGPFRCWAFSTDSKLLVTTHAEGTIRTWDMADGKRVAELRGHPGSVAALACSPDGTALVSTCTSCTILRWQKTAWQGK